MYPRDRHVDISTILRHTYNVNGRISSKATYVINCGKFKAVCDNLNTKEEMRNAVILQNTVQTKLVITETYFGIRVIRDIYEHTYLIIFSNYHYPGKFFFTNFILHIKITTCATLDFLNIFLL